MDAEQETWLTVREFAALLRLPVSSVYEAIAGGRLEHRRVGRNIRIHRDAGFVAATAAPQSRRLTRRRQIVVIRERARRAAS